MDWELEALKSCAPKKALRRPEPRAQAEDAVQAMLRAHTRLGLGDRAAVGMLHAPRGATLLEPEESGAMNRIAICATALASRCSHLLRRRLHNPLSTLRSIHNLKNRCGSACMRD